MQLTIGMATYRDFDGVYFTLQALRLYQDLEDVELLVVDNYGCTATRDFVQGWTGGRYLHAPDASGTAAPRDRVFREAKGEAVLCLDCHVLLAPGAVSRLKQYYREHPRTRDLIQGPLLYDDLKTLASHFEPTWRDSMWGVWAHDDRCDDPEAEPFEIPMQGLGLFSCRKDAWPGFNPLFRGFGGEEGYLHEKIRQQGGWCLCLPWLRWAHRFQRPAGVPYPLNLVDRIVNYLIGHRELDLDEQPVIDHFSQHHAEMVNAAVVEADRVMPRRPIASVSERNGHLERLNAEPAGPVRILGCWYTNNHVHPQILGSSLNRLKLAQRRSRQPVDIRTCSWAEIADNPFPGYLTHFRLGVHLGIAMQILRILYEAKSEGLRPDLVCFLEHDVLYPEDYFDRLAEVWRQDHERPGLTHLDYIGMNQTGWCDVICRQEPLHQMAMRHTFALEHLEQVQRDCIVKAVVCLEPADLSILAKIPFQGERPSVHVNHSRHFTSHFNCYARDSGGKVVHPYWGDYREFYPEGEAQTQ